MWKYKVSSFYAPLHVTQLLKDLELVFSLTKYWEPVARIMYNLQLYFVFKSKPAI